MDNDYDVYPIVHRGKIYNLITAFDMTFREVRRLIDILTEKKAFEETEEDKFMGPGKLFTVELEGYRYELDVFGYEIVIYTREKL